MIFKVIPPKKTAKLPNVEKPPRVQDCVCGNRTHTFT